MDVPVSRELLEPMMMPATVLATSPRMMHESDTELGCDHSTVSSNESIVPSVTPRLFMIDEGLIAAFET